MVRSIFYILLLSVALMACTSKSRPVAQTEQTWSLDVEHADTLLRHAVDSIRFTYDFFEANQYEQVNFYHDSDVHVMLDEEKPVFTSDDYLQMRDRYAVRTALLTDFEAEAVLGNVKIILQAALPQLIS